MGNSNGKQQRAIAKGNSDERQAMTAMAAATAAKAMMTARAEMAARATTATAAMEATAAIASTQQRHQQTRGVKGALELTVTTAATAKIAAKSNGGRAETAGRVEMCLAKKKK